MSTVLIGKPDFAGQIAKTLDKTIFLEIVERTFPDGEICPRLLLTEKNQLVGNHAIIAMQLELNQPKNQYLISFLWTIYNVKQYNPTKISCVIPYHIYSRQDRESRQGEPVSIRYLALALESAGMDNFITFNSHIYGKTELKDFFPNSYAEDISVIPLLAQPLKSEISSPEELICLAPDEGALFLAKEFAGAIGTPYFSAIHKERDPDTGEITQTFVNMDIDLHDRSVVIIDDLVSSGSTLIGAAKIAKKKGAKEVFFSYIHAVHSHANFKKLKKENPTLIFTTDTIKSDFKGFRTVSVIPLISDWIKRNR